MTMKCQTWSGDFRELTLDYQLPRSLLGGDDIQRRGDFLDVNDVLVRFIGPWYSQFQIFTFQQVGRHILQLQSCELQQEILLEQFFLLLDPTPQIN